MIIDRGYKRIKKELQAMAKHEVAIGVLGKAGQTQYPDADATLIDVAIWNHYGTRRKGKVHIPKRPFMDIAIRKYEQNMLNAVIAGINAIIRGSDARTQLDRLGLLHTGHIQKVIAALKTPPNAPATIRKKGVDNPLIDTGRLRQAISHIVRRKRFF